MNLTLPAVVQRPVRRSRVARPNIVFTPEPSEHDLMIGRLEEAARMCGLSPDALTRSYSGS